MRARKRPYLPILDRSLELFARLRPPSWIFKMSRLASRLLYRSRRSIPPISMFTTDFKIPKLNGANYRDWTFNMRLYLDSLDLFGHVDGSIGVPDEEASEKVKQEYKTALKKAWTYICLAVEPDQKIHVRNTTNAKEAWDALKSQFSRISISQIVRLRQKYYSTKFQSGGNMLEHINHVKSLHDQLKEMGANIDDGELAMTLLASLPDEFKPLILH